MVWQTYNPMNSFAQGFQTMGNFIDQRRRTDMAEEAFKLEKEDRQRLIDRQEISDAMTMLSADWYDPETGELSLDRVNGSINSPLMRPALRNLLKKEYGIDAEIDSVVPDPSDDKGERMVVNIRHADGTVAPAFRNADDDDPNNDEIVTFGKQNLTAYAAGAMKLFAPEEFAAMMAARKEGRTLSELEEFAFDQAKRERDEMGRPAVGLGAAAPTITVGGGAAVGTTAGVRSPGPAAPTAAPQSPAPTSAAPQATAPAPAGRQPPATDSRLMHGVRLIQELKAAQEAPGLPVSRTGEAAAGVVTDRAARGQGSSEPLLGAANASADRSQQNADRVREISGRVNQFVRENPELAKQAMDHVYKGTPLPDGTAARAAGQRFRAGVKDAGGAIESFARATTQSLINQVKPVGQFLTEALGGARAFTDGASGAPPRMADGKPVPRNAVVVAPPRAPNAPAPSIRESAEVIASRITVPQVARTQGGPKRPAISDEDLRKVVHRGAVLLRKGAITQEQFQKSIDTALGKKKPAHQIDTGAHVVFLDENLNPMMSIAKEASPDAQLSAQASMVAARYKAIAKQYEVEGTNRRESFKDREAWYKRIQGSYENEEQGREAVAEIDAAVDSLGLDIYRPGVSHLVEEAARARAAYMKDGGPLWFDRDAPRGVGLTPFVVANALGLEASDGDSLEAAQETVLSPLRAISEKVGVRINEQTMMGGVANAVGRGIPADVASIILGQYLEAAPTQVTAASAQALGKAIESEYMKLTTR